MTQILPQCQNLQEQVEALLQLLRQEPSLRAEDTTAVQTSLRKAISPKFEIVFAGAFSAGKSMLINALLERELLYSAEGHATGTECYIEYAEPDKERVVLTFLSEAEIREQTTVLCQQLGLGAAANINQPEVIQLLQEGCEAIIQLEGGKDKSERAKQANALMLLLDGFKENRSRIHTVNNATYSMEQFNLSNLAEAANFARRSSRSAVLKRVEYYCNHPLLQDGNVIIDTPGIDAPVERDAQLTYRKIEHPDTSAVVCVFKTAATGELTSEETTLISRTHQSQSIRDRVFNVFNRVDETWYNDQLRRRLENLLNTQFRDSTRVYRTSGLLGFYGSQIKGKSGSERFGLDSIFAETLKGADGSEETPQFVYEFIRYCLISGKLSPNKFSIPPSVLQASTNNDKYVQILHALGTPLINQLIQDSGIEEFRSAITRYLKEEKRPQLFAALADDLQPPCITLKNRYLGERRYLDSQPREIEAMKQQELVRLTQDLSDIGEEFKEHIKQEVSDVVGGTSSLVDDDFRKLKSRMLYRLDQLIETFSVLDANKRAARSHPRNSVTPLLGILAEAFYYLANELEDVLVIESKELIGKFFQRLTDQVRKSDYYSNLYRLLGNDGGIEQKLEQLKQEVTHALVSYARVECDRYVRERPEFYTGSFGTTGFYQLQQTLLQTSQTYDCSSMVQAEPAIRQLLQMDFQEKVKQTLTQTFRQAINETLNTHLLSGANQKAVEILQQYDQARAYLEQTLSKEAEENIKRNQQRQSEVDNKIKAYNDAVEGLNLCLEAMQLNRKKLPLIHETDFLPLSPDPEVLNFISADNDNGNSVTHSAEVANSAEQM